MNAKKVWSECRKKRADTIACKELSGSNLPQKKDPNRTEIGVSLDTARPSELHAKLCLQEALIFSLKRSHLNMETENSHLKAKMLALQSEHERCLARLHNLRDYDDLRRKSALGFDAGFEIGQSEV